MILCNVINVKIDTGSGGRVLSDVEYVLVHHVALLHSNKCIVSIWVSALNIKCYC